jgi:hypothetical protein
MEHAIPKVEELLMFIRRDHRRTLSDDLLLRPPKDPLGRSIPSSDVSLDVETDDSDRRCLDERFKRFALLV